MYSFFIDKENGNVVTIYETDNESGIVTDIFDRFVIPDVTWNVCKLNTYSDGHPDAFELWNDEPEKCSCVCAWYRLYFPDGDHIDRLM